jgi:hypothetical protein
VKADSVSMPISLSARLMRLVGIFLAGAVVVTITGCSSAPSSSSSSPNVPLTITPGPYHDGQSIDVSVGPNKVFKPYASIKILQCADPGGAVSALPTKALLSCDGNTIQGNTILVGSDGSFSQHGYVVYTLPNESTLAETSDQKPVCDDKNMCVLYIGQNQEDFTAPKIFSPPFTVSRSSGH